MFVLFPRSLLLVVVLIAISIRIASGLKCHEDIIGQDTGYELKDCEASVKYCAKLENTKTGETFRACALPKMCQDHEELHISCCNSDKCNSAITMTLSYSSLLLVFIITLFIF
ncbi:Lymphocyte antigen 6D-like protein [Aphelenchoides besseyi]|nr:Lymphocyte antigen 6D-like protein [Aphelenchoides besseyi]